MNAEQQAAFEWAKNQKFQSVAARYAKTLADLIESMQAENKTLREASQKVLEGLQKLDSALDSATCDGDALKDRAEEAERRENAAVGDMTKLATKPITPCHSCSKTCLFPASLAPGLQPATWCRDWQWRGPQEAKKGESEEK